MVKMHFRKVVCEVTETKKGIKATCIASGGKKPKTVAITVDNFKVKEKGMVGYLVGE